MKGWHLQSRFPDSSHGANAQLASWLNVPPPMQDLRDLPSTARDGGLRFVYSTIETLLKDDVLEVSLANQG